MVNWNKSNMKTWLISTLLLQIVEPQVLERRIRQIFRENHTLICGKDGNTQVFLYKKYISVSLNTIFSSVEVEFSTTKDGKLKVSRGNNSFDDEEPVWKKIACKVLNDACYNEGNHFKQKLSPFQNEYFSLKCNTEQELSYLYRFRAFDLTNFGWFIIGSLLFSAAKSLSRSVVFHYTSGASFGIVMTCMIILVLLYKLLPYKKAILSSIVAGCSISLYFIDHVTKIAWELMTKYPQEVLCFCVFSGLLSMALMYYFGPPKNERSLNLIQWSLQIISIYMVYQSTYCKEFAITFTAVLIFFQYVSIFNILMKFLSLIIPKKLLLVFNAPPTRRLLTMEEYEEQGKVETEKALKELSFYCSSPNCNAWKTATRLNDPKRFGRFLETGEQFTEDEIAAYDTEDFSNNEFDIDREEQPKTSFSYPPSSKSSISMSLHERTGNSLNKTANGSMWISDDDSLAFLED